MTLEVQPSAWDPLLSESGGTDVYYHRGYLEAAAIAHAGRCSFLHLRDRGGAVVFPCVVRELPELAIRDATTVAYGGPLGLGPDPPFAEFSALYEEWCAERGIVTTFVRFHPLVANHRHAPAGFHLERVEGTVAWPLDGDLEAGIHRHHRRLIRKTEAAGLRVSVTIGPEHLDGFTALYEETMRRLDAPAYYFFPVPYWDALVEQLGERLVLLEASRDGHVVAGVLCLATRPWLHFHLGATSDEARTLGASHRLLYEAARFGQGEGYERFHLGSGFGGEGGSLLEFKRRFTNSPLLEQWFGKRVHDVERYIEVTGSETIDFSGYFPAYRRAAPQVASGEGAAREAAPRA